MTMTVYGVLMLIMAGAYVVALCVVRGAPWKLLFAAIAGVHLLRAMAYISSWLGFGFAIFRIEAWCDPLLVGGVLGVSLWDHFSGARRHWLHWTGVVTFAATSSIRLIWWFASLLR